MPSANADLIEEVYRLARRADHRALRAYIHDDARWEPATANAWQPCDSADEIVRTLLWRADANRLRPGEMVELGSRVLIQLRGRRLERLGAKGLIPRLFQIVVCRDGKIASLHDYARRADAHAAAGLSA
jgi:ketosteroid isomerase-like protein